jgi:hypothetical protein
LKKSIKIILVLVLLLLIGAWAYWQQYKNGIVKNSIENAISKGTDSLYFIHYDSSFIDEVNGNASFYRVTLQSDSLQKQLQQFDTASSATIYNIQVGEVSIKGANISGLISNTVIEANSILIKSPVIYIISSGKKEKKILNSNDSLAIYEKLLGKFKSINAKEIVIENGILNFAGKTGEPHTALRDINVQLKNFRVDSSRNYQNIISYFVKDVVAKVKEVYIKGEKNIAVFSDVEYNASERFIHLKKFQQKNNNGDIIFDVSETAINDISTDAFILNQQLKAGSLISNGGLLTFYRKLVVNKEATKDEIEIDNNYFDEALLQKVDIKNTKILIYNRDKPQEEPFVLNNVKFNASDIQTVDSGTNIKNLISNSRWTLSADGFSYITTNKRYKITFGAFDINNDNSSMRIKNINVAPMFSQAAFSKIIPCQQDLYTILLKDILLTGIDTKLLLTQKKLEALTATLQLDFKVYRNRTLAPDPTNKVGKYPHQLIQTIKFPFSIKNVIVKNSNIYYTEKGDLSKKEGTVFFKNIQASILNVTNIKELISQNNLLSVDVNGSFMGLSKLHSIWKMPLNSANCEFEI